VSEEITGTTGTVAMPPTPATATAPVTSEVSQAAAAPVVVTSPATATEFDISKYIDKNGEFLPGWKEGLIDQSQWKEGFYDQVKGVKGLLKIALDTKKMMGKKTIVPLSDKSTPEEISEYRRAHGITGKYNYTPPKDIELLDMSPEAMAPAFVELDKVHLTQKQFDVVNGIYAKNIQMLQQAVTANDKTEFDEAERIIRAESGDNYDSDLHLVNRVIDENTANWSEEKRVKLLEALNESPLKPYIYSFIKEVGSKFVEHKLIADAEATMGPADLEALIHEEMATSAYKNRSDPAHKQSVVKVQRMFQEREERKKKLQATGII
jgi:hypothetical protein